MSGKDVARRGSGGDAPALFDAASLPTLDLQDIATESEPELVARGAAYAREFATVEHQPTILATNIATVCVALRIKLGAMDGKSHEYRQAVRLMYASSNVPPATLDRLKGNVRWHVSQLLRRHMTTRELEAHGLLTTSALERLQDNRAQSAALLEAFKTSVDAERTAVPRKPKKGGNATSKDTPGVVGARVKATADHIRLAQVARGIVGQLRPDVIKENMVPGQRAKLDEELAELQKAIAALRRLTRKPSSGT